ncbi:MAG: hypothetical protein IJP49_11280 [Bacteroidales bacterium]|jgi:hypothetical protein|nr:hypothetical protein [Bacteroidales bacterium]
MEKIYFLLTSVLQTSGDIWIPWYATSGGLTLSFLMTLGISLLFVILFYFVLTLIKPALTNVHYYLTMFLNAVVCFFAVFFVAKGMIVKYIIDNDLISIDPLAETTAASGTLDMWLVAANSAIYALVFFFLFSIIIKRWGPHGTNLIPFGK